MSLRREVARASTPLYEPIPLEELKITTLEQLGRLVMNYRSRTYKNANLLYLVQNISLLIEAEKNPRALNFIMDVVLSISSYIKIAKNNIQDEFFAYELKTPRGETLKAISNIDGYTYLVKPIIHTYYRELSFQQMNKLLYEVVENTDVDTFKFIMDKQLKTVKKQHILYLISEIKDEDTLNEFYSISDISREDIDIESLLHYIYDYSFNYRPHKFRNMISVLTRQDKLDYIQQIIEHTHSKEAKKSVLYNISMGIFLEKNVKLPLDSLSYTEVVKLFLKNYSMYMNKTDMFVVFYKDLEKISGTDYSKYKIEDDPVVDTLDTTLDITAIVYQYVDM